MKFKTLFILLLSIFLVGCSKPNINEENLIADDVPGDTIVTFKDSKLEELVRIELNKTEGDITADDMLNLSDIRIWEAGVKDLSGLEYAKNMTYITISGEEIKSLDPISNLKKVYKITLSYSKVEDLPISFSKDVKLTGLSIIDTPINDISFVKDMVTLEDITATDAGLKNIDAFSKLINLKTLYLRGNQIESIKSLSGKNKLETLNLQGNLVNDISPLKNLSSLTTVNLSYNPVTNLSSLETLSKLEELTIYKYHDVKHLIFDQVDKLIESGVEVLHHR